MQNKLIEENNSLKLKLIPYTKNIKESDTIDLLSVYSI